MSRTPTSPTSAPGPERLDSFERDLLVELRSVVERRADTAPAPARRTRRRVVAGAAAAAVAATVGALTLGSGSAAFAVESGRDGAVVVRIHEFTDAASLETALAERGIDADVDYSGSGSTITVDQDGEVGVGDAPPDAEVPAEARPLDSTFAGGPEDSAAGSGDPAGACGLDATGKAPMALSRDGDDYVVTLAGPTLADGNALRLRTVTGPGGDTLVATYAFGDLTCGAMVTG